jgi:hypothetical protein
LSCAFNVSHSPVYRWPIRVLSLQNFVSQFPLLIHSYLSSYHLSIFLSICLSSYQLLALCLWIAQTNTVTKSSLHLALNSQESTKIKQIRFFHKLKNTLNVFLTTKRSTYVLFYYSKYSWVVFCAGDHWKHGAIARIHLLKEAGNSVAIMNACNETWGVWGWVTRLQS